MRGSPGRTLDGVGTLVRLGLAAVWLVSGGLKLADPGQAYLAVQAYEVLPAELVGVVATALPLVEVVLGLLLALGVLTRASAAVSVVVLVLFVAGVAQAWARGLTIDCGCFGGGGRVAEGETEYPQDILRDLGFLALAGWLLVRPGTLLSLDGWLRRPRTDVPGDGTHGAHGGTGASGDDGETRKDTEPSGRSGTSRTQAAATTADDRE
ncbi:MauE/DoxX family redox-associated membrane protein [Saccharomonospora iraqiensis]|uniref:MauE/DoxX family redox-associated membrane protein n=1 Tax=Saccharomonospora iraqiensis TaxID=52698 RepID=UPI000401D915|nr:MauE/DoxX family redox-associated membrane protein [Saccharomonospora iraqiensis]